MPTMDSEGFRSVMAGWDLDIINTVFRFVTVGAPFNPKCFLCTYTVWYEYVVADAYRDSIADSKAV
jgi:hypothetical protein